MNNIGVAPLHWASIIGNVRICDTLIKHGAQIDAVDNIGSTPLHWTSNKGKAIFMLDLELNKI